MKRTIFLVFVLGLPFEASLGAQDDPFETRIYNVEFLTREIQDYPGESLSLSQDSIGVTISAETSFASTQISGGDLISLIRNNVAEDSWEHVQASMHYASGVLTVTNRESVHGRIAQYITYWRGFFGKMIAIDAMIVSIDPELLATIRASGRPDRPAAIPAEHVTKIREAIREGKLASLIKTMRVTAHPGQRVHMRDIVRRRFIRDHDVQIATGVVALDPIIDLYSSGISIDVRPYLEPFGNAVTLETRINRTVPTGVTERKLKLPREVMPAWPVTGGAPKAKAPNLLNPRAGSRIDEPKVELPKVAIDRIRTVLTVRNLETAIVASTFRNGRDILFLLTPAIIVMDEKAAPVPVFDEERLLKLFDVSPLTRGIQDFAGPRMRLTSPSAGGGALTGAMFTLNEPAVRFKMEDIVGMIQTKIARETWGNRRNSIEETGKGTLVIRQRPAVLRDIERFLNDLLATRAQMITTEALLIGFKGGARAEWERQIPALRPGGYFVEKAKFDELLKEAYKGQNVRIIERGEITSFPQQRVYSARLEQEMILSDYEPQVATVAKQFDPIMEVLSSGFVLDVRPHFIQGTERIAVSLRAARTEHGVRELEGATPGAGPLQAPTGTGFRRESDVTCKKGFYTLVGIESRGSGAAAEDVALFLRARANILK